ncbi:MAG: peptidoglycan DD-metalloendopeptidase family protein [Alphaproteobacteria bacterium]|nr:peptidoglycan DD-metalloendopeptidase family protein [Alphaproteobacteria bacterium]
MKRKTAFFASTCCVSLLLLGCQRTDPPAPVVHADEAAPRLTKKRAPVKKPQPVKKAPASDLADERIVLRPIPDENAPKPLESERIVLRQPQDKAPPKGKAFEDEILASVEGIEDDQKQSLPEKTPLTDTSQDGVKKKEERHMLPDKPKASPAKEESKASRDLSDDDGDDDTPTAAPLTKGAAAVGASTAVIKGALDAKPAASPLPSEGEKKSAPKEETSPSRFAWPLSGAILKEFCQDSPATRNDGLNIAASLKAPVKASKTGTVVYIGNDIKGFGNLVLVKHDGPWMTAYAHLDSFAVSRGQTLKAGEVLGYVGQSGGVKEPQLHFEVRKNSVPVNPRLFLGS